jgi:5-methylcytosine-specific restriction enzyme A
MRGLCAEARCPDPPVYRGRCQRHARQRDRQINRAGRAIYNTKRWKLTRRRKLTETPLCECGAIATDVHHLQDIADGGDPWAMANLQSLCHSCHSKTTRAAQQPCPRCHGATTQGTVGWPPVQVTCEYCNGEGRVR